MIAGPPSGGRPPLTDAKPLVLAGAHSRAGLWMLAGDMVLMGPLALLAWSGFDDGLASMMIMPLSVIIGSLVGIACIQHHRQRLRVDASGFRIRMGRRSRTLSWDQVRGNLAVAVIPQHAKGIMSIIAKSLLLPVITVEGERIELPCLISGSYNELRARRHVERVMAAIAARDPGPGAGTVDPPRPDGLILTEHRDKEASRFFYLGIACGFLIQAWQSWWSDYADAPIRIFAGGLAVLGLGLIMLEVHGLRPDDTTTADTSGLRIRRGWRRRNLSWEQVRGHLEARAIPPNGKGGLSRGGTWNWGWRAQVHYRDGERDVPLAGASLMAWDEASALQLARERIDLLRSYDPDPTAAAWSRPAASAHPPATPPTQYGIPAPQPEAPAYPSVRTPSPYAAQPYPPAPMAPLDCRPGGVSAPAHPSAVPPVYPPAAPPAQYGMLAPQSYLPAAPAPSDDSWREPGLYGRPASAWEIMTSPAGKAIDKKEGLQ